MLILDKKLPVEQDTIKIILGFDWHLSAKGCNTSGVKNIFKRLRENDDYYFIGGGDLFDMAFYQSVAKENGLNDEYRDMFLEETSTIPDFWEKKVLGFVSGNHEARLTRLLGMDFYNGLIPFKYRPHWKSTSKIWVKDDFCIYDPISFILKVSWGSRLGEYRQYTQNIFVHHGKGTGALIGSKVYNTEKADFIEGVDIVIMGHTHVKSIHNQQKLKFNSTSATLMEEEKTYIIAGSQLRWRDYAEQKLLAPGGIGNPVLQLKGIGQSKVSVTIPEWIS